jgi:hypothetical protein
MKFSSSESYSIQTCLLIDRFVLGEVHLPVSPLSHVSVIAPVPSIDIVLFYSQQYRNLTNGSDVNEKHYLYHKTNLVELFATNSSKVSISTLMVILGFHRALL